MLFQDPETGKTKDNYDYNLVRYAVENLETPFHGWNMTKEIKVRPHSLFKHINPDKPCPCGSEKSYEECCLNKNGVDYPHYQFVFDREPKNGTEEVIFT